MPRKAKARPDPLTRDEVVRVAVAVADAGGLEALSMRVLATRLEVVPMALYKHVDNKEGLVDDMIDVVFGEVGEAAFPLEGDWRKDLYGRAIAMREALLRHPWAIGLMGSRTRPGPATLHHHDAVMGCLREAGFSFRKALRAYNTMDSYIYGSLLQQRNLPFESPQESAELAAEVMASGSLAEDYPYLAEVVVELGKQGFDFTTAYEFGLDLILDGIARLRGASSAGDV